MCFLVTAVFPALEEPGNADTEEEKDSGQRAARLPRGSCTPILSASLPLIELCVVSAERLWPHVLPSAVPGDCLP